MTASAGIQNLSRQDTARFFVMVYVNDVRKVRGEKAHKFKDDDVFIVWFAKTLENWKALVGTTVTDQYYEVTYNGLKKETYVDVYEKFEQVVFPDEVSV